MNFTFGLQLFGGSSSTTNTSTYTPSEYELELQKQQADYSKAVAPNALSLNNTAMNLLKDSLGTVQVDYNGMNKTAQNQIANATNNMSNLASSNNTATTTANGSLGNMLGQYASLGSSATSQLGNLANGLLPEAYQQNMEKSISSGVNNTVGKAINSLGTRGVINSSVTNGAMNDIEKNVSDTMAQQYSNNLNNVASLVNQQYNVGTDSLGRQANLTQQMLSNTQNNNSQNSGLYSNLINSATTPITTAAAAQEAAQTPAGNLWNYSLGLNGATTGALSAAAGKGTTTQAQTTSGGGGFFGNLLGGALGGAATGYAQGAASGIFCFPAGTKIKMADGGKKSIEQVHTGDSVMTGSGTPGKVVKTMDPHYSDVYSIIATDGHTTCTLTQPFMQTDGTYVAVDDMLIGTDLKGVGKVHSIMYSGALKVYDMQVDGDNSYIADGFVAQGGSSSVWGCE